MANEQNTTKKIIRNGFAAVTRADIQNAAGVALEQIEVIEALFRAIEQLTTDKTIKQLCKHGALQADYQSNDIDCLRECAVKAGVVGELVDDMVNRLNTVQ